MAFWSSTTKFIKLDDTTEIRISSVCAVSPLMGDTPDKQNYIVQFTNGAHETIQESDIPRASFLAEWHKT